MAVHPVSPLNLNECLLLEINTDSKKGHIIFPYQSSSQSKYEFDHFLPNFEQLISDRMSRNPLFMLAAGEFNIQLSSSWKKDQSATEGSQVDAITSASGLSQLICEHTRTLPNSTLYTDLIFINHSNFILNSVIHASLYSNYHHQLVYAKLNLKIEYPQLYEQLVWDYKNSNIQIHCK